MQIRNRQIIELTSDDILAAVQEYLEKHSNILEVSHMEMFLTENSDDFTAVVTLPLTKLTVVEEE